MGNLINKDRIRHILHFNIWIVLLDIAVFSLSYLLTLYIRLYVNGIFRAGNTIWITTGAIFRIIRLPHWLFSPYLDCTEACGSMQDCTI